MSELLAPIVYQLGVGGSLGFFVGYATKKLTKIVAVTIGVIAFLLIYLGYEGVIKINYDRLSEVLQSWIGPLGQASGVLTSVIANFPFAGSFIAGTVLGFKFG